MFDLTSIKPASRFDPTSPIKKVSPRPQPQVVSKPVEKVNTNDKLLKLKADFDSLENGSGESAAAVGEVKYQQVLESNRASSGVRAFNLSNFKPIVESGKLNSARADEIYRKDLSEGKIKEDYENDVFVG